MFLVQLLSSTSGWANTSINTHARDRLGSLVEYLARGPLSNERLTIRPNGEVELELKSPWKNGTTHLLYSPEEFLEKLLALIPSPRSHLVRWRVCRAGEGEESSHQTPHSGRRSYSSLRLKKDSSLATRLHPRMEKEPKSLTTRGPRCSQESSRQM